MRLSQLSGYKFDNILSKTLSEQFHSDFTSENLKEKIHGAEGLYVYCPIVSNKRYVGGLSHKKKYIAHKITFKP